MIFYSTIKVIFLSLYALIHELYIYDKLFHKLTINDKKKTKKDQKIMKTSWIMFAFIVDSNSVSHEIFCLASREVLFDYTSCMPRH